jgi:low affinity Fe/Cu permease
LRLRASKRVLKTQFAARAGSYQDYLSSPRTQVVSETPNQHWFSRFASETATNSGRPWAFGLAAAFVAGWLITGPIFGFSDSWQLVMNTISSIVTFLMVFLIQNAQNRDSTALQLKLDELIRATASRKDLVGIEDMSEPELQSVREQVVEKSNRASRSP